MRLLLIATICLWFLPLGRSFSAPVSYLRQIKPLLKARCYSCHGALKQKARLRLDTVALMRKGGRHGPVIVPRHPEKSLLIERITDQDPSERMPPEGEPLTREQSQLIREWLLQGAPAPKEEVAESDPRKHWAFQKPRKVPLPGIRNPSRASNPIDLFIVAQQERQGVKPLPLADKITLIRRATLDLTGLPPTRPEVMAFLADDKPDSYQRLIERLLASPAYGERWGRHWMDVWRYSDWYGRRQVNDVRNSYPHIWRWRDWIVSSFNQDYGYDRMIISMLAADEAHPDNDKQIVALGYLARNWFSLNYDQWMKDLVEHTGKAFLGLRLNCAHCHDHKYDPISQKEYFRFRAFFEPLELRQDRVPGGPALTKYKRYVPGSGASLKPIVAGIARVYDHNLNAKTWMYRLGDARDRFKGPPVSPGGLAMIGGEDLDMKSVSLPPVAWYPGLKSFVQQEEINKRKVALTNAKAACEKGKKANLSPLAQVALTSRLDHASAELQAIEARVAADQARYQDHIPQWQPLAKAAAQAEHQAKVASAKAQIAEAEKKQSEAKDAKARKAAQQQLAKAKKAWSLLTKSVKDSLNYTPLGPTYPQQSTGRRLALAKWLTQRDNALTARVAVNHVWMRHFGKPLVETVFDFGRGGKEPTHPQLLDWLAVELREHQWSLKHLHRLILNSTTYRLASKHPSQPLLASQDRENRYYWRFNSRRLEAEAIRDSILAVADQLDQAVGGPEIQPAQEAISKRRSLYFATYPEAGGAMRFASTFDAPDPCGCYRRKETMAPQQALALTNSRLILNSSRAMARKWPLNVSERRFLSELFEQVLSRLPTGKERDLCRSFLEKQRQLFSRSSLKATSVKGIIPASTDPVARSRESLARALLNHSDFVTLP